VRAKKANSRSKSIRYLLSLDRTLHRPSVRRLVERVKPARRRTSAKVTAKQATRSAARSSKPARPAARRARAQRPGDASGSGSQFFLEPRTIFLGLGCVVIAAVLLTGLGQGPEEDAQIARINESPFASSSNADTVDVQDVEPTREPVSRPTTTRPAPAPVEPAPTVRTAALTSAPVPETTPAVDSAPAEVIASTPVTVTGCLERKDDVYRLTDTSGELTPKSRTWKSGFLRKRSASIELIDAAHLRLASFVGRRIETTGVVEDREMRVKTLRVQGTCD
jgi:hypothetical protein